MNHVRIGRRRNSHYFGDCVFAVRPQAAARSRSPGRESGQGVQGDGGRFAEVGGAGAQHDPAGSEDGRAGLSGLDQRRGRADQCCDYAGR